MSPRKQVIAWKQEVYVRSRNTQGFLALLDVCRVLWEWHGLLMDAALANPVIQLLVNTLWWQGLVFLLAYWKELLFQGGGEKSFHYEEHRPLFPLRCLSTGSAQPPRAQMEADRSEIQNSSPQRARQPPFLAPLSQELYREGRSHQLSISCPSDQQLVGAGQYPFSARRSQGA